MRRRGTKIYREFVNDFQLSIEVEFQTSESLNTLQYEKLTVHDKNCFFQNRVLTE